VAGRREVYVCGADEGIVTKPPIAFQLLAPAQAEVLHCGPAGNITVQHLAPAGSYNASTASSLDESHLQECQQAQQRQKEHWAPAPETGRISLTEILAALDENRFRLFAQKIIPTQEGSRSNGGPNYELLLRMVDPQGKLVMPIDFIPTAERNNIMADIDRWVLREALLRCDERIARMPNFSISINLSAQSLNDPRFPGFLQDVMAKTCLPPNHVTFEITETALIDNLQGAAALLEQLRGMGCRIALDDFGVGLCSFYYLKYFKVDYIKIEGSFVRNIDSCAVDLAIVKAINQMAHDLKIQTVAEFVKDAAVLKRLRELKVDFSQGYGVGMPGPLEDLLQAAQEEKPQRIRKTTRARKVA